MAKIINEHLTPPEIQWPEFKNERERIKVYSERFQNTPFEEAFSEIYGAKIHFTNNDISDAINVLPHDNVDLGTVINVHIIGVGKDNVTIDAMNVKENIVCRNNLWKYKKFQSSEYYKGLKLKAKVVKKDKKQVVVDLFEPMVDEWKQEIALHPLNQYNYIYDRSTVATGLKLTRGGYICKVAVPSISEFVGEPYYIDAFIPGSQIVLNIEKDFSKWEGKSVRVFATNFIPSPVNPSKMVAVCSCKRYLQHIGNINMIHMFKSYIEGEDGSDWWKEFTKQPQTGTVTGIINSSTKCGVFVEIPEYRITGMVNMNPVDIVKYAPGMNIMVTIDGFDLPTYYNDEVDQVQHGVPYVFNDENPELVEKCGLKPLLKLVV